jgi:anaerobic selenocysteine-containing dehydrogenase
LAILKAISGNLDVPGGDLFTQKPEIENITRPLPEPGTPPIGEERFPLFCRSRKEGHALCLPRAILEEKPYPIKGMIISGGNPSLEWPDSRKTREALGKLEFLTVIDVVRSPDSRYADVVLPACSFPERDEHRVNVYLNLPCITLRRKVSEPVCGLPDQMIWMKLARHMGWAKFFPWQSSAEGIDHLLSPLGISYRDLVSSDGIYRYEERSYRKYEKEGFNTPSGKVEIYPEPLGSMGIDPLPIREEPHRSHESADEFPLILTTGSNLLAYTHWQYRYIPRLRKMYPESAVDIHPATALWYGILQDSIVEVVTRNGRITLNANLTPKIRSDTVHIPQGWEEANVNELTGTEDVDPISKFPNLKSLRCRVRRL